MMKRTLSVAMAVAFAATLAAPAMAAEDGDFTTSEPVLSRVVTAPFRVITGGIGAVAGLVGGSAKGVGTGWTESNEWAHDVHPNDAGVVDNAAPEKISRNLLYIPTVILGSAVLVPKNILVGGVKGAVEYGEKGNAFWNRI